MTERDYLGELEEMVLLAALRLGSEAYGASILRELDEQAGRDVPRGSIYVTLDRLDSKGYVDLREGEASEGRRGRPRRTVSVTADGIAALRRTHAVRDRLRDGLDELLQT